MTALLDPPTKSETVVILMDLNEEVDRRCGQIVIPTAPGLTTYVTKPGENYDDIHEALDEHFRNKGSLFWLIMPRLKQVYVYRSPFEAKILRESDTLKGGDVLPGFEVKVGSLFPPVEVPTT